MPSKTPVTTSVVTEKLAILGQQIRTHRKALRVNATTTAQAAGMSRVTLYRIESGEPSVTMGAYLNAMAVLGLDFGILMPPIEVSD
jgi:transcriptional regulator with XRE-family HTH domain